MRIKTLIITVAFILLTVILMQNTQQDSFNILWTIVHISKSIMLIIFGLAGLIVGLVISRQKTMRQSAHDNNIDTLSNQHTDTLSDEDREYLN